ncbi:MAG: hypothetical protein ACTIJ6_05365 [Leucobacter sp.]
MSATSIVREHRQQLLQLRMLADADLRALLAAAEGLGVAGARNLLITALPELLSPYITASGELAAVLFEDLRSEAARRGTFYAASVDSVPAPARVEALSRWAVAPLANETLDSTAFTRLSGSAARMIMDSSRNTVELNGARERVGFQRMPRAGCCAFCGLLASRGAVYRSEASAGGVVGRGSDRTGYDAQGRRLSGAAGGGVKARGSMALGDGYHDDCQCVVMPVYEGTEMAALADATEKRYSDMYVQSVRLDDTRAVSPKLTLAEWRKVHGTK